MNAPNVTPRRDSILLDDIGDGLESHAVAYLGDGRDDQARLLFLARSLVVWCTTVPGDEMARLADAAESAPDPLGTLARAARRETESVRLRLKMRE